ncbi:MAG: beta-lactamase family protein [Bacteroidetes bacterium]|nr:beta-lactamase family protein [Bacteroidota bacterium]
MTHQKIDQLEERDLLSITRSPGAQYIVVNAKEIITECYAGEADVFNKIPVSCSTTFNAFSITKTATAAAILKLAEQKRILLSDFVNPMFNEYHFQYPFTIEQLVAHQAGFGDPIPISWIHLASEENRFNESKFITRIIDENSKQKFKPGTKFSYSSVGYLLLSRIIEKVSGESYDEYIRNNIIPTPENQSCLDFFIHNEATQAVGYNSRFSFSNILLSFFLDRKKFIKGNFGTLTAFNNFYVNGKGYGGLIGNVRGLAAYMQSYLSGKIFKEKSTQEMMFTEQKGGMALGWFTGQLDGEKYVCHAGGGGGYYCEIRIYPELKIATALLRNKSGFRDLRLLDKVDSKTIFS